MNSSFNIEGNSFMPHPYTHFFTIFCAEQFAAHRDITKLVYTDRLCNLYYTDTNDSSWYRSSDWLHRSCTWTGLTRHWRLFWFLPFYIFLFFGYVCQNKVTTLSFSVHVKLLYRIESYMPTYGLGRGFTGQDKSMDLC